MEKEKVEKNPDPITGSPGAHPVGVGLGTALGGTAGGAAGAALAGAAVGSAGGPVGTVAGVVAGGIAGAVAGKEVAESINPTREYDPEEEDAYWRGNFHTRGYVEEGTNYEDYRPAYEYGWESRVLYPDRRFEDVEPDLQIGWKWTQARMDWEQARPAVRDAWDRIEVRHSGIEKATGTSSPPRT